MATEAVEVGRAGEGVTRESVGRPVGVGAREVVAMAAVRGDRLCNPAPRARRS